jgi:hypothetical protein
MIKSPGYFCVPDCVNNKGDRHNHCHGHAGPVLVVVETMVMVTPEILKQGGNALPTAQGSQTFPVNRPYLLRTFSVRHAWSRLVSSGLTGKVTTLLTQAAELAIFGGRECISVELMDQAADNGIYKFAPQDF